MTKAFWHSSAVCFILAAAFTLDQIPRGSSPPIAGVSQSQDSTEATPPGVGSFDPDPGVYIAFMRAKAICDTYPDRCGFARRMVGRLKEQGICVLGTDPVRVIPCPVAITVQCKGDEDCVRAMGGAIE